MEDNSGSKIDQLATWLGATLASAFFSSLERFSCVNLSTADNDDEDEDEDNNRPLTLDLPNSSIADPSDAANLPVWSIDRSINRSLSLGYVLSVNLWRLS